jgi:hypothetical protein
MSSRDCGKNTAGTVATAESSKPPIEMMKKANTALRAPSAPLTMSSRDEVSLAISGTEILVSPTTTDDCILPVAAVISEYVSPCR